jgi:hypothetical protein
LRNTGLEEEEEEKDDDYDDDYDDVCFSGNVLQNMVRRLLKYLYTSQVRDKHSVSNSRIRI